MSKITLYQTSNEYLLKAFCLLSEKCYDSNTNTIVVINQEDQIATFDKVLWSYSRKKYIPHATYLDDHHNLQPIYITNKFENPNNSSALILINHTYQELVDIFDKIASSGNIFERINILLSNISEKDASNYIQLISKSPLANYNLQHFKQNIKGLWEDITINVN